GLARVAVTFQVDADGILSVTAREQLTGVSQSITVKPSAGLTDDEIERMLMASIEHAEEDVQARLLIDARIEAQRILKAAEQQIETNGDLLAPEERRDIETAMQALRETAQGKDHRPVQDAIQRLDHVRDRKSTRLNSSHGSISYAVFCLKKKTTQQAQVACSPGTETTARFPPARRRAAVRTVRLGGPDPASPPDANAAPSARAASAPRVE